MMFSCSENSMKLRQDKLSFDINGKQIQQGVMFSGYRQVTDRAFNQMAAMSSIK